MIIHSKSVRNNVFPNRMAEGIEYAGTWTEYDKTNNEQQRQDPICYFDR